MLESVKSKLPVTSKLFALFSATLSSLKSEFEKTRPPCCISLPLRTLTKNSNTICWVDKKGTHFSNSFPFETTVLLVTLNNIRFGSITCFNFVGFRSSSYLNSFIVNKTCALITVILHLEFKYIFQKNQIIFENIFVTFLGSFYFFFVFELWLDSNRMRGFFWGFLLFVFFCFIKCPRSALWPTISCCFGQQLNIGKLVGTFICKVNWGLGMRLRKNWSLKLRLHTTHPPDFCYGKKCPQYLLLHQIKCVSCV